MPPPWGCPVYVLKPRLRDGGKIPKWDPQSRCGQYMGASLLHALTVGLIRNLQTGSITPLFHLIYDDYFETVHASAEDEPECWPDLIMFQSHNSLTFDDDVGFTWLCHFLFVPSTTFGVGGSVWFGSITVTKI